MFARISACCVLTIATIAGLAPQAAAEATSPGKLQPLVNDMVAQLQVACRDNVAEHEARYEQLAAVVESWRRAERSEANNQLLAEWLREAMRRSMPGSRAPLPSTPRFAGGPDDKSAGDPFNDDPLQE